MNERRGRSGVFFATDLPRSPVKDFSPIRSCELGAASADDDVWDEVCSIVGDGVEVVG